jgi:hypothetical protein
MLASSDLASLQQHADVLKFMMLLFGSGLLATCLWIFRSMNRNIDLLFKLVAELQQNLSKHQACLGRICTAHTINHNQEIECQ